MPFSSSWACIGRRWLLWACVGLRLPSLTAVGLRGPALAFVGLVVIKKLKMKSTLRKRRTYGPNDVSGVIWALFHLCGPSLAIVGCCEPSWACVGVRWPSLTSVGLCGAALAFVSRSWLLWAFLGLVVIKKIKNKMYIKKKTHLWPKRRVWRRLGPFSSLWAFVGRRWLLWAFLGLRWLLCDGLSRFTMLINMPLSAEFVRWPGGEC